jgi:geranylgeranyl transferase type-1 subunit beta
LQAPFAKLDTNRMTLVHFSVHALDILCETLWDDPQQQAELGLDKQAIIEWIYALQITMPREPPPQGVTIAPISHVGFLGGTFLGPIPQMDDDPQNMTTTTTTTTHFDYHQGHIAMTYTALCTLQALGDDLSRIDRFGIVAALATLQLDDGCFACVAGDDSEHDMRFLYCACAISYMLDDWSGVDIPRAVQYIQNCKAYDGAIATVSNQEGHGGSTYCAVASLVLMDQVEEVLSGIGSTDCYSSSSSGNTTDDTVGSPSCWKDELIHWCVHRQADGGGMQGRPNKAEDTCYSWWIGGTLRLLGYEDLLDGVPLRNFIISCQSTMGGFGKEVNAFPDPLHSFYSLGWLSLSSHPPSAEKATNTDVPPLSLQKLNCTLGIRQSRVDKFGNRPLP